MHRRWQREEVQSELWADNLQGHRRGSSLPMVQVIEQGFAYGRQSSHLPPSTHSEALLSLQKIFPPALSIHFTLLPSVPFLLPPILVVCSARVWFLGVLHSCTLLLHWEMPYPLPLTNVHCGNDIGFQKKKKQPTAWRFRPAHSLPFSSGVLLWSSLTNVRSERVPVSDLTVFWFEETCLLYFFSWEKLNLRGLRGNILSIWNSFCDMDLCDP